MKKEEFIKTLRKNDIHVCYHESWWSKSRHADPIKNEFGFGGNQEELEKHIKNIKRKRTFLSAP